MPATASKIKIKHFKLTNKSLWEIQSGSVYHETFLGLMIMWVKVLEGKHVFKNLNF